MDRFSEKQIEINKRRIEASSRYARLWSKIISEWNSPAEHDQVWLTYSANYLFRTGDIRWAIDPLTLRWRIKDAPAVDVMRDLSGLSFVLLTHAHKDHLDLDLLAALRRAPITWVVPEFLLTTVIEKAGLPRQNIIIPTPLQPLELSGTQILPFDGLHWETTAEGHRRGVPAMGYLIECNGKRWLFPGDTRNYRASQLPHPGSVDILFAHLWLGRRSALMEEPPLTEAFCQFCCDLKPQRIILTHLHELARRADDFWDDSHVQKVRSWFQTRSSPIVVGHVCMGESILL